MNWKPPGEMEPGVAVVLEPKVHGRTTSGLEDPEGDWLCAWCHHRVANERDRFCFDGKDEFTFANPEGIRFNIITFSQAGGCTRSGGPTLEYTWFAGHAWSYCHCGDCGQHLGWYYKGQHEFVGLIRDRIVRALCLRN